MCAAERAIGSRVIATRPPHTGGAVPQISQWSRGDEDNAQETHDHDGVAGTVDQRGDCPGARSTKTVTARGDNGSTKAVTARSGNGQESDSHRAKARPAAGVE